MLQKFKKSFFVAILSLFTLVAAAPAQAQYGLQKTGTGAGYKQSDLLSYVSTFISAFLSLIAILFLGLMLYAGIRWMTARGNEELSGKAKTALEAGITGLIITIMAYAIATFVMGRLISK